MNTIYGSRTFIVCAISAILLGALFVYCVYGDSSRKKPVTEEQMFDESYNEMQMVEVSDTLYDDVQASVPNQVN